MMNHSFNSRRAFLRTMGSLTAGLAVSGTALGKVLPPSERTLTFLNLHTGKSLKSTFCVAGKLVSDSLKDINYVLRDHRTNEVCVMDTRLLTLLDDLRLKLGTEKPFHIISGYRSPKTNKMLSQKSNHVAKKSLHMQGKAIDIRVPGMDIKKVQRAALALHGGGVGLYTRSNFIHLDVGRVRQWGV